MDDLVKLVNIFYNSKGDCEISNVEFHKCILQTIPYFDGLFKYQDNIELKLSQECAVLFKKYLYKQEIKSSDLNVELGIEIRELSKYLDIKFFIDIKNKLFVKVLESDSEEQFEFFKEFNRYDKRFKITSKQVESLKYDNLHSYAYCLQYGIGCDKDERKAYELYKQNWEENKNTNSLHNYAYCLRDGIGCSKDERKAYELYKQNWEENKNTNSLHNYAYCIKQGIGCSKDERKACELFKQNWEENKNTNSLHMYAYCLQDGIGCSKDERKACELFKQNWEENKNTNSLHMYAYCLQDGIGCSKDERKAYNYLSTFYSKYSSILH